MNTCTCLPTDRNVLCPTHGNHRYACPNCKQPVFVCQGVASCWICNFHGTAEEAHIAAPTTPIAFFKCAECSAPTTPAITPGGDPVHACTACGKCYSADNHALALMGATEAAEFARGIGLVEDDGTEQHDDERYAEYMRDCAEEDAFAANERSIAYEADANGWEEHPIWAGV